MSTQKELTQLTVVELRARAKKLGISPIPRTKAAILEAVIAVSETPTFLQTSKEYTFRELQKLCSQNKDVGIPCSGKGVNKAFLLGNLQKHGLLGRAAADKSPGQGSGKIVTDSKAPSRSLSGSSAGGLESQYSSLYKHKYPELYANFKDVAGEASILNFFEAYAKELPVFASGGGKARLPPPDIWMILYMETKASTEELGGLIDLEMVINGDITFETMMPTNDILSHNPISLLDYPLLSVFLASSFPVYRYILLYNDSPHYNGVSTTSKEAQSDLNEIRGPVTTAILLSDARVDPAALWNSATLLASSRGLMDALKLLLADERVTAPFYAITKATENEYVDIVKLLLSRDDLYLIPDGPGVAVLLQAAIGLGDVDILKLILNDKRFPTVDIDYLDLQGVSDDIAKLIHGSTTNEFEL